MVPPKVSLLKLTQGETIKELYENNHFIQDMLVPLASLKDSLKCFEEEVQVIGFNNSFLYSELLIRQFITRFTPFGFARSNFPQIRVCYGPSTIPNLFSLTSERTAFQKSAISIPWKRLVELRNLSEKTTGKDYVEQIYVKLPRCQVSWYLQFDQIHFLVLDSFDAIQVALKIW